MESTLERAACALCKAQSGCDDYDAMDPAFQENLMDHVRAVLEAIREPTGIDDAGRDVTGGPPYAPHEIPKLGYLQIAIIWRAMIDAALSE